VLPEGAEAVRAYVEGYGGPAALSDLEDGDPETEADMASVLDDAEFVAEFPDPSEEYVERVGFARFRQEGRRVTIEAETQHEERLALEFRAGSDLRIDDPL
jgi:S1-C subfamily serine protease